MASINDLSLASGLSAKVEEVCAGLETGTAPILDQVSELTAEQAAYIGVSKQGPYKADAYRY